jgi:hypothetical protein
LTTELVLAGWQMDGWGEKLILGTTWHIQKMTANFKSTFDYLLM